MTLPAGRPPRPSDRPNLGTVRASQVGEESALRTMQFAVNARQRQQALDLEREIFEEGRLLREMQTLDLFQKLQRAQVRFSPKELRTLAQFDSASPEDKALLYSKALEMGPEMFADILEHSNTLAEIEAKTKDRVGLAGINMRRKLAGLDPLTEEDVAGQEIPGAEATRLTASAATTERTTARIRSQEEQKALDRELSAGRLQLATRAQEFVEEKFAEDAPRRKAALENLELRNDRLVQQVADAQRMQDMNLFEDDRDIFKFFRSAYLVQMVGSDNESIDQDAAAIAQREALRSLEEVQGGSTITEAYVNALDRSEDLRPKTGFFQDLFGEGRQETPEIPTTERKRKTGQAPREGRESGGQTTPSGFEEPAARAIDQSIEVQLKQGNEIDVGTIVNDLAGFGHADLDAPSGVTVAGVELTIRQLIKRKLTELQKRGTSGGDQGQGAGSSGAGEDR